MASVLIRYRFTLLWYSLSFALERDGSTKRGTLLKSVEWNSRNGGDSWLAAAKLKRWRGNGEEIREKGAAGSGPDVGSKVGKVQFKDSRSSGASQTSDPVSSLVSTAFHWAVALVESEQQCCRTPLRRARAVRRRALQRRRQRPQALLHQQLGVDLTGAGARLAVQHPQHQQRRGSMRGVRGSRRSPSQPTPCTPHSTAQTPALAHGHGKQSYADEVNLGRE